MKFPYLILILLVQAIIACEKPGLEETAASKAFFDLKSFAKSEVAAQSEAGTRLQKTIILNGKEEKALPAIVNWEDELKVFSVNDINKSSWVGKFVIDTVSLDQGQSITYTSSDSKIPVKKLTVETDSTQAVTRVIIETKQKNPLFTSSQVADYRPGTGYLISGKQKALILKEQTYSIRAVILPKE
jgi:hypothetical protein